MAAYRVPWYQKVGRVVITLLFRIVFRIISRVKVEGLENIPASGAYVLAFNHVSLYDPPILVSSLPTPPEILGAVDVWSRPGQSILARVYGGIPIHRGVVDRTAMAMMLAAVRSGLPLMISPEGGRSHQPGLRQGKTGIIYVIDKTHIPVVPIGITGTTDEYVRLAFSGKRPLVSLKIGKPFNLPEMISPDHTPAEIRQLKVDVIMRRIADLLPEEYKGIYR